MADGWQNQIKSIIKNTMMYANTNLMQNNVPRMWCDGMEFKILQCEFIHMSFNGIENLFRDEPEIMCHGLHYSISYDGK